MAPVAVPVTGTATTTSTSTLTTSIKATSIQAASKHPLDPLTPDEHSTVKIVAASLVVRQYVAENTDINAIKFITLYLLPPPKKVVLAHLGIPLSPGAKPEAPTPIIRQAESD
ncbi:hypothetical protein H0H93_003255, partial [Arthromyces matolae]